MTPFALTLAEMLKVSHKDAVHFRIGKRHFGCSICEYTAWSHKWVDGHIAEMLKYEKCPAPRNKMGDYMKNKLDPKYSIEKYCKVCKEKIDCEIEYLTFHIAVMEIMSRGGGTPLFGWDDYDKQYNKFLTRMGELMEMKINYLLKKGDRSPIIDPLGKKLQEEERAWNRDLEDWR